MRLFISFHSVQRIAVKILKIIIFFLESCLIEGISLQRESIELCLLCHPNSKAIIDPIVEAVLRKMKRCSMLSLCFLQRMHQLGFSEWFGSFLCRISIVLMLWWVSVQRKNLHFFWNIGFLHLLVTIGSGRWGGLILSIGYKELLL